MPRPRKYRRVCQFPQTLSFSPEEGQEEQVRRILRLFLDPGSQWDAQLQMDVIRKQTDSALIELMARTVALPQDFVAYVIGYPAQETEGDAEHDEENNAENEAENEAEAKKAE